MTMNIFERASRKALRFSSKQGDLTTEQLWQLPLTTKERGKSDLDGIAIAVNTELKNISEASFVSLTPDPRKTDLDLKLEILKHVIKSKMSDKAAAEERVVINERKRKLYAALEAKEESELAGKTRAELQAEIASLG